MLTKKQRQCKLSVIAKGHNCDINHQGSVGKMEADGAVACCKRSKDLMMFNTPDTLEMVNKKPIIL